MEQAPRVVVTSMLALYSPYVEVGAHRQRMAGELAAAAQSLQYYVGGGSIILFKALVLFLNLEDDDKTGYACCP
jgi:hypothetical protein